MDIILQPLNTLFKTFMRKITPARNRAVSDMCLKTSW